MNSKEIIINLKAPYWGAWKKYKWTKGVEGLGLKEETLKKALREDSTIVFKIARYGTYKIRPVKASLAVNTFKSYYTARDNTRLAVIPRSACTKVIRI